MSAILEKLCLSTPSFSRFCLSSAVVFLIICVVAYAMMAPQTTVIVQAANFSSAFHRLGYYVPDPEENLPKAKPTSGLSAVKTMTMRTAPHDRPETPQSQSMRTAVRAAAGLMARRACQAARNSTLQLPSTAVISSATTAAPDGIEEPFGEEEIRKGVRRPQKSKSLTRMNCPESWNITKGRYSDRRRMFVSSSVLPNVKRMTT